MTSPRSILALLLLLSLPALAQKPAPSSLDDLRQSFLQRVRLASGSLNDYYEKALANLETSLAAVGDYEQARAVKARRADLTALSATAPAPAPGIPLLVEKAKLSGSVLATADSLQGWRTTNCTAEWILPRFTPGTYQVTLTYLMAPRPPPPPTPGAPPPRLLEPLDAVPFMFRESSLLASAAKNKVPFKLALSPKDQVLTLPGTIELTRTPVVLRLNSEVACPLNEVIIRDLRLLPVAAAESAEPTAATHLPFLDELKQLQATQASKLAAAQKPVFDTYLTALTTLSAPLPDVAEAIAAEQRRVKNLQEGKAPKRAAGVRLDNFEEIVDARFVPDPANTGDTFKIEHQGQQRRIHLAWIACPPLDPAEQKPMRLALNRFGISTEAALYLGQSAQEFTALYLEGRPLRLLVRQEKKPDEAAHALVFLEDIGLFQNVLIDQGLAVVDAPMNKAPTSMENALLADLQEREAAARKQSPAPGGWGQPGKP